jgi:Tol biopolymer transport system component
VPAGSVSLTVVDRTGRTVSAIPAERPWTPRFSPDGHSVVYGAFGAGRTTSDLWVTDLDAGTTRRITDDDGDANDPQWSADGSRIAYSVGAPGGKDLVLRSLTDGTVRTFARDGTQFPNDWRRDGSALLMTEEAGNGRYDILVQPADGSAPRPYAATDADETGARVSPDGRWVAYTSDESGKAEVYLDSYAQPGRGRVKISLGGGAYPVWRGDGRELFYWRDGSLVAVRFAASVDGAQPVSGAQTVLFRAPYQMSINTMYDVSPDGQRFVIVRQP